MRIYLKRLSKEPWFGKKRAAWGIRPVSWHGWLFTVIFVLVLTSLMVLSLVNYEYVWQIESVTLLVIAIYVITALFTSDQRRHR